jgi:tetratricopeptide (TPR) repeat protein
MPIISDKELPDDKRALWLKALSAFELRNYDYAIRLISAVLKDNPGFLAGRKALRNAEIAATKGKKSFMSGLSAASLTGASKVKKDPVAAMELAEKNLEADPFNAPANHLLKEAAKAAGYPEIAVFALETIAQGKPDDTKVLHELAEQYLSMGLADRAVDVYTRITTINPADLVATKRGKDASAQASMKSGGWEKEGTYIDKMKDSAEAKLLAEKDRVVRSLEMTESQIAEVTPQWDTHQDGVDLTRRLAKLWEERYEYKQDAESLHGTLYFFRHANTLLNGSDPAIARRIADLELKEVDTGIKEHEAHVKELEDWLAAGGEHHEDAPQFRQQLEESRKVRDDLRAKRNQSVIDDAKRRVERNPTDLQLRFELGERLLEAGLFNEAIPELQRARQNPNARLKAMSHLGRCFVLKGMLDMAANQFQSAASEMSAMDIVKKDTLYELGMVYERMGRKEEYLKCMKEIMEVDYGYKDVAARVETSYGG